MAHVYDTDVAYEPAVERTFHWSPAQVIAALIGIGYLVLGAVALSRTGFNVHHVTIPARYVWRWHHTPILGLVELAFGALMLLAAARPSVAKPLMGLLSLAAIGLGVAVLIDAFPHQLHHWLGVYRADAWLYVATGALGLVASVASPTFFHARRLGRLPRRTTVR
jgi:hypothetical protein